ncbi:type II CRISPR RNA-guided endonuclease Cas9 [Bifidobacterium bombi]|uniref:CRISPR-associated protein, Csn1 family n=1 Tax=Bifidobacterium bombi DSM 19703 TaxID=1341695 RepID=A0A080N644_9BIFI|nr:type II CRISPR RNA-guided endonuclease Cas9 [Bifidobacterium bombi]KFF31259.1 CRISPR-associated protein, Csn1 family [Bifidobacterium bombi DSM 19703]
MSQHRRYRIGIDVGLNSVGLAAVEIDANHDNPLDEIPISILNAQSVIHDGGVDPDEAKSATSRRASAGVARRTRRLHKSKRQRLAKLDEVLNELGYPVEDESQFPAGSNPYIAWQVRAKLAETFIPDVETRKRMISIAIRHIARHRGWRNPYSSVADAERMSHTPSPFMVEYAKKLDFEINDRRTNGFYHSPWQSVDEEGKRLSKSELEKQPKIEDWNDNPINGKTIAQLVVSSLEPQTKIRRDLTHGLQTESTLNIQTEKLHQSDYIHELETIFERQHVDQTTQEQLLEATFHTKNPKAVGAAAKLVGKDALDSRYYRASRATPAFEEYRVMAAIDTLRIREHGTERQLTTDERRKLFDFIKGLPSKKTKNEPSISSLTWGDVADFLGIQRIDLRGLGSLKDGEPVSAKQPPVIETNDIMQKAPDPIAAWWSQANTKERDRFVEFMSNAGAIKDTSDEVRNIDAEISQLLEELTGSELESLDKITLTSGRAAYSSQTLRNITNYMYETGCDLTTARQELYHVGKNWAPPAPPIYEHTGNPSVDRTFSIIHRWLCNMRDQYGEPETVNIEYVRDGFSSTSTQLAEQRERDRRYADNLKMLSNYEGASSRSDVRRIKALQRQNCQCIYCGRTITFETCQMDHVLPRKGPGSDSKFENLVATCGECNKSKSDTLYMNWAKTYPNTNLQDVLRRIQEWSKDGWMTDKRWRQYKEALILRLEATEKQEPLDNRSMESVSYMARELRNRIYGFYGWHDQDDALKQGRQRVFVSSGSMTAAARRTPFESPLIKGADEETYESSLPWLDGMKGKTRLDRRHHAVDASIIAMMRPQIVKILTEAQEIRSEQHDKYRKGQTPDYVCKRRDYWRNWRGTPDTRDEEVFNYWAGEQLRTLTDLVSQKMADDEIPVIYPTRLRLGNGSAHKDTVVSMMTRKVGDELSITAINKAESGALYTALTRDSDFDWKTGLSANPNRRIRVHDKWFEADDTIKFLEPAVEVVLKNNTRARIDPEALDKVHSTLYVPVRGGIAEAGNSIHHVRFYKIPKLNSKGKQTGSIYAMLRVLTIDLAMNQYDKETGKKQDLFTLPLPESSLSRRFSEPKLRQALIDGTAEYLGWAVVDDELEIPAFANARITEEQAINGSFTDRLLHSFPGTHKFRFAGFSRNTEIAIRPVQLASEGLIETDENRKRQQLRLTQPNTEYSNSIKNVLKSGLHLKVNTLFQTGILVTRANSQGKQSIRFSTVEE